MAGKGFGKMDRESFAKGLSELCRAEKLVPDSSQVTDVALGEESFALGDGSEVAFLLEGRIVAGKASAAYVRAGISMWSYEGDDCSCLFETVWLSEADSDAALRSARPVADAASRAKGLGSLLRRERPEAWAALVSVREGSRIGKASPVSARAACKAGRSRSGSL